MRCRLSNKGATMMVQTHQTAPTQFVEASGIRFAYRHRRQRIPTFPSPTHQDQQNAPSHRSFLDARGRTDLDRFIVTEGNAHSSSKPEPQPPRYTICRNVTAGPTSPPTAIRASPARSDGPPSACPFTIGRYLHLLEAKASPSSQTPF